MAGPRTAAIIRLQRCLRIFDLHSQLSAARRSEPENHTRRAENRPGTASLLRGGSLDYTNQAGSLRILLFSSYAVSRQARDDRTQPGSTAVSPYHLWARCMEALQSGTILH